MSIATQITRIQTDRNTIRNKLVEIGLATNTDNLDVLAEAVDSIVDNGSISAQVKEGETYTIPKGYHNGSGTVSGVAGGGNYTLQSKSVTPTKKQQTITPDDGYYGLSDTIVNAIPDAYQDVTSVTAGAADVLSGKTIVSSTGVVTAGTMTNNGATNKTLDTSVVSFTIPQGYHSGMGVVKITLEEKSATPTKSAQTITPAAGKVLSKVNVAAIPDAYQDVTGVTATAEQVLIGADFVDAAGDVVSGVMPDNGAITKTLTVSDKEYTIPAGYHSGEGRVNIVPETKSVTPTKGAQNINASTGKVLSTVTVEPIPAAYQDVTGVDAVAADVLDGKKIVSSTGELVTGAMPNNGDTSASIDGLTTMSVTIPAGYTAGGTVTLTSDIEDALAAI